MSEKKGTRGGKRAGSGRPVNTIPFEELDKLLHMQCSLSEVAYFFSMKADTIKAIIQRDKKMTFDEYADKFKQHMKIALRRKMVDLAINQDDKQAIFYLTKQYIGENQESSYSNKVKKPKRLVFEVIKKERGKA